MASAMLAIDHRNTARDLAVSDARIVLRISRLTLRLPKRPKKSHHLGSAHVEMPSEGMISDLFKSRGHTINPQPSPSLLVYKLQKDKQIDSSRVTCSFFVFRKIMTTKWKFWSKPWHLKCSFTTLLERITKRNALNQGTILPHTGRQVHCQYFDHESCRRPGTPRAGHLKPPGQFPKWYTFWPGGSPLFMDSKEK